VVQPADIVNEVKSALWRDASGLPESLSESLERADGHAEMASALADPSVRRLVVSGNGASWYVANAMWLAALGSEAEVEVLTVPAGMLAAGGFRWRDGDFLLALSSSGSLRDLLEALDDPRLPRPFGVITADADSPLGRSAELRALVSVKQQRAVTHSQAYLGTLLVGLDLIGRVARDAGLRDAVAGVPELVAGQLDEAPGWAAETLAGFPMLPPRAAVAFGTGAAWPAAQEAALLLKEVAAIPTEGVETREGATTGMYALDEQHLVISLGLADDRLADEAAAVCAGRGAQVLSVPWPAGGDLQVAAAAHFLHPLALAISLALVQGLDPDQPSWYAAYESTARRQTQPEEQR
jgi:fructoselysine-6-P-deglycase FrlB-like protein